MRRLFWSWWPWFLGALWAFAVDRFGLGLALGAMAAFSHLIAPVETPPQFGLDHDLDVESDEFLATMIGATGAPMVAGNRLEILNNGDEFYPAMLRDIAAAEWSITIEAYIYWSGKIGFEFAQVLAERARAGVRIKILLDAIGSSDIGDDIVQQLKGSGCQIAWYNPIRWYTLGRINQRTHRKSLIIDGRVAYTGGAGIADDWLGHAEDEKHWRDIQVRLEGPGVGPLQTGFSQNWLETTRELISGPLYYPLPDVVGDVSALTIISTPVTGASTARILYYLSIAAARQSILIATPYFAPDAAALDTLIDAKKRGVDVRIMLAGKRDRNWLSRNNALRTYGRLLAVGVQIYEYEPTLLHQKTMVVDGVWSTIGTTNFDSRSFAHNEENNVCVYDRRIAQQLVAIFEADQRCCRRVQFDDWRKRGVMQRAQEILAALWHEQV
jgi:cardiolipin synthase